MDGGIGVLFSGAVLSGEMLLSFMIIFVGEKLIGFALLFCFRCNGSFDLLMGQECSGILCTFTQEFVIWIKRFRF